MRQLASIQKIIAIEPIKGADAIEKVQVLGWELVVKKGEYRLGDLCIYCEIDSLLPEKPEFEFLSARKFRIRTIRLKGQISQGICFPLSFLPKDFEILEGRDCTETLEITKYEAPIPASLAGIMKGSFPSFIPKTDETRVQVLQEILLKYKGENCYITEKLDGTSVTYFVKDGEFGVCSRNLELLEDEENTLWKMAKQLQIHEKLASLNGNFALQGELVGEGIQGNKLKIKAQAIYFFNIFDIDKFEHVSFDKFKLIINELALNTAPILEEKYLLETDIPTLVKKAKIRSITNPLAWAEGIVIRPHIEKYDKNFVNILGNIGRLSFKVINPEFLLKYDE